MWAHVIFCFVLGSGIVQGSQMTATKNLLYLYCFTKSCSPLFTVSLKANPVLVTVFQLYRYIQIQCQKKSGKIRASQMHVVLIESV